VFRFSRMGPKGTGKQLGEPNRRRIAHRLPAEDLHARGRERRLQIVRDTAFRPHLGPNNTTFRMVDPLLFAFDGKKNLLAPTGD
jgi:hypothetical protein